MTREEELSTIMDNYEYEADCIDHHLDEIRKAVMHLMWTSCGETYRFNQIGIIYTAMEEILDSRMEMRHCFDNVVDMVDTEEATNDTEKES